MKGRIIMKKVYISENTLESMKRNHRNLYSTVEEIKAEYAKLRELYDEDHAPVIAEAYSQTGKFEGYVFN